VSIKPLLGRPQVGAETQVTHRVVSRQGFWTFLANGAVVDGAKTRDPGNSADSTRTIRPGTLMGRLTASPNRYANSVIGVTSGALTGAGTSITLSAAAAAELVRRNGVTGTFKLTGPPAAAGVVQTRTATYSAVNTDTGVVTLTALGANQVERVRFNIASTGGNLQLNVAKTDGTFATTANIAWNATDATYLASINSALDAATGVAGGVVATAIAATDTDLGVTLTYSGTGYAGLPWRRAEVVVYPTSSTAASYEPVTAAANGAFVAGSLVQPTDGSETPLTVVPDGYGLLIPEDSSHVEWPLAPIGGVIDFPQLLPAVSDASLKTWIRERLSSVAGGKFTFSDLY
jgi:hypothetical protein